MSIDQVAHESSGDHAFWMLRQRLPVMGYANPKWRWGRSAGRLDPNHGEAADDSRHIESLWRPHGYDESAGPP